VITGRVVGAGAVSAGFTVTGELARKAMRTVIRRNTYRLETLVKAHASGRPGPNAPTGDYRRSINSQVVDTSLYVVGYVGTNAVQGRRLEQGFTGTDSLGRYYDQPPYPHFGPGADQLSPIFQADMETTMSKALE
jgi:hypothetical protein